MNFPVGRQHCHLRKRNDAIVISVQKRIHPHFQPRSSVRHSLPVISHLASWIRGEMWSDPRRTAHRNRVRKIAASKPVHGSGAPPQVPIQDAKVWANDSRRCWGGLGRSICILAQEALGGAQQSDLRAWPGPCRILRRAERGQRLARTRAQRLFAGASAGLLARRRHFGQAPTMRLTDLRFLARLHPAFCLQTSVTGFCVTPRVRE